MRHTVSAFLLILSVLGVGCNTQDHVYKVGVSVLPTSSEIDPRNNQINSFHYINLQLYYPLFEKMENGQLQSHYLDLAATRALDSSFRRFQMCLLRGVAFSNGDPIQVEDLVTSLEAVHKVKRNLIGAKEIIERTQACIEVSLKAPDIFYFDKLTTVQSAVLPRVDRLPRIGLGPYRLDRISAGEISLEATPGQHVEDFKEVRFTRIKNSEEGLRAELHDWNQIPLVAIPDAIKSKSQGVKRRLLKTYFFLVDIDSQQKRKIISALLEEYRTDFVKELGLPVEPSNMYLPVGLPGNSVERKKERLISRGPIKNKVRFLCPSTNYCESISRVTTIISKNRGIQFEVVQMEPEQVIQRAYSNEEMITLVGNDTTEYDPSGFFTHFLADSKLTNGSIGGLRGAVAKAAVALSASEREELYRKAHELVLNSDYVVPLGQVVAVQYYPRFIRNLQLLDYTIGLPPIHLFKVDL